MKHISHQRDLIRRLSAAFRDHCVFVSSANRRGKRTAFSKHADAGGGGMRWAMAELLSTRKMCDLQVLHQQHREATFEHVSDAYRFLPLEQTILEAQTF